MKTWNKEDVFEILPTAIKAIIIYFKLLYSRWNVTCKHLTVTCVSLPKHMIFNLMRLESLQKRVATISFSLRDAAPTMLVDVDTARK